MRLDLLSNPDWLAFEQRYPIAYEFMRERALRAELRSLRTTGILWADEHARMQHLSLRFPDERSDNWRWKEA